MHVFVISKKIRAESINPGQRDLNKWSKPTILRLLFSVIAAGPHMVSL
jgi:hypothetical protein